jgi:hypothetical protein
MKHSNIIFGSDLYDLQFQDVEAFFSSQRDETLNLEFKSFTAHGDYAQKENAIKKGVCALLNSEGGIIIWGAPVETRDQNGNTSAIGGLTPFPSLLDRDRLINILSSSITPLPIGIRVQRLNDGNNNFIFVIEVEKSVERPHQFDNRYYIRLDGQTRVAPHYLISALMKSTNFPVVRGHLRLKHIRSNGNSIILRFRKLIYNTSDFINDKNVYFKIITTNGHIYVNNLLQGGTYENRHPLLSKGAPLMGDFDLVIPAASAHEDIRIALNFGGEKAPSRTSIYNYRLNMGSLVLGDIADETPYLISKDENKLPSDITNNSTEQNIELILNA